VRVNGREDQDEDQGNPWLKSIAPAVTIAGVSVTVLIVDDHPTFRRFARRLLEEAGFRVVGEAEDGAEAIEAARDLNPQAVLLDVLLPDRSGLEIAAELAETLQAAAVVLTSSRSAADLGAALEEAPARGFIPKSAFSSGAFAELVEPR
jgi:DNA-binding NarL/FixJ family response regulator